MSRSTAARKAPLPAVDEFAVTAVPIDRCTVAPENPRAHRETEDLDALVASIHASLADDGPGVLQAGICYEEGGEYLFTAGRRRLDAAREAGLLAFPAIVLEKEAAIRAGLLEQENHVAMHPADQAKAFARELALPGASTAAIANAYGVTETIVRQRAALANLAPPIFDAFAEDRIGIQVAQTWANAPPERQEAALARVGLTASLWQIRDALQDGAIESDDRLALFVGEEAYKAAGGEVEQDLFDLDNEDWNEEEEGPKPPPPSRFTNRELVERLAKEKIDAKVAELTKESWGWVETGDFLPHTLRKHASGKKADRPNYGAFIVLKHDGQLQVDKWLTREGSTARASDGETGTKAPKPDIGNNSHLILTTAATRAVQHQLCVQPEAALPLLLARMARNHWSHEGFFQAEDEIVGVSSRQHDGGARNLKIGGQKLWDELDAKWKARLDRRWHTAEVHIAKWPLAEQLDLLAFLIAAQVSGVEGLAGDGSEIRRYRLAFAGRLGGIGEGKDRVHPADTWTPDADWFKGCATGWLAEQATKLDVTPPDSRKGTLCAILADKAEQMSWVPDLMRRMTGCIDVPPPMEPTGEDDEQTDLEEFTGGRLK